MWGAREKPRRDDEPRNDAHRHGGLSAMAGRDAMLQAQWARVRGRLREEFGEAAYRNWLRSMSLVELRDGVVRISVPTRFFRDWIAQHYSDRLRALWNAENDAVTSVEIIMSAGAAAEPEIVPRETTPREPAPRETVVREAAKDSTAEPQDLKDVSATLDPRFTFENFVTGKPN